MSRSGRINPGLAGLLALAMIVTMPPGDSSARAAGCHVSDRAVLGMPLSWERDPVFELAAMPAHRAPLVLTHVPCSEEVPHRVGSTGVTIGPADLVAGEVVMTTPSLSLLDPDEQKLLDPPVSRLDRPPRSVIPAAPARPARSLEPQR